MEDIKNLSYLFNQVPTYTQETFNIFDEKDGFYYLNQSETERICEYIGLNQEKIITKCISCSYDFPFNAINYIQTLDVNNDLKSVDEIFLATYVQSGPGPSTKIGLSRYTRKFNISEYSNLKIREDKIVDKVFFIKYFFQCTHDPKHTYQMYTVVKLNNNIATVIKVGQYPSTIDVQGFDFDKYKKELNKYNSYIDYKKADLCFSEKFYAGAYTYLRRIFEKQVNFYIGDTKLSDNRMETKIEYAKSRFNPDVQAVLSNLYSILSLGIHQLEEEQCQEYYEYLKAAIDMQLQFEKSKREEEEQKKSLKIKLDKIAQLHKK